MWEKMYKLPQRTTGNKRMTKMLALIVGLVSFNALANTTYTDVTEYTNRTASDYCGKSQECKVDFSQKLLYAYKDGEKDGASSRFKASTLIKRYYKKCIG